MAVTAPGSPYVETSDLVANYPGVSESLAERVDLVGVLPFANSTARGTALPSPTDGQYSYLQDTNATEYYNGSAWVAAGVAPGLVHINTTTFSAVSSVSVDDCFTGTYDNYLLVMAGVSSADNTITARLRVSGTDASGANYSYMRDTSFGTTSSLQGLSNQTSMLVGRIKSTGFSCNINLYSPNQGAITIHNAFGGNNNNMGLSFGDHSLTTAYDGITYIPASGTITGTLRIYGYKN